MRKTKILIDGRLLSNQNTGISRYTKELIKSYEKEYGKANVKIIINPSFKPEDDTRYLITPLKPYNIFHFFLFYIVLRKEDFDLLHSPFYANSFIKPSNKIFIITVHDLMYRAISDYFSNNFLINFFAIKYYDIVVRRSLRNADMVVSVSKETANDISSAFGENSIVIREGVNRFKRNENSDVRPEDVLRKFKVRNQDFFFYVGNLRRQKNIPFLIQSFVKAKTGKKLLILGNYDQKKIPKSFTMSERVYFGGYVTDYELSVLYKSCTAFIYPSLFEGFGLPVLEALNCGAKVISSNSGALKEFPESIVNFFNPTIESELVYLIENVDNLPLDRDLVQNALDYYDWQNAFTEMHSNIRLRLETMKR